MNLNEKNQQEQFGTQNRAAQLSRARRGQRHRGTGHSTVRRNSNPLNTSMKIKKGIRTRGPTLEKMKSHDTHQPYGDDAPHGPTSGRSDGPTGTFWPNFATPRGYSDGIAHGNIRGPSGGGGESLTCQSTWRWERKTKPMTAKSSPS